MNRIIVKKTQRIKELSNFLNSLILLLLVFGIIQEDPMAWTWFVRPSATVFQFYLHDD